MKIAGFTAMALCAVIAGSLGSAAYSFCSADRGMLGGTGDKLARNENNYDEFYINNRNAPLTRSDDWEQIASEELLSREDFAGIDGSASAIPLTAELARQFCGAADDRTADRSFRNKKPVLQFLWNFRESVPVSLLKKQHRAFIPHCCPVPFSLDFRAFRLLLSSYMFWSARSNTCATLGSPSYRSAIFSTK